MRKGKYILGGIRKIEFEHDSTFADELRSVVDRHFVNATKDDLRALLMRVERDGDPHDKFTDDELRRIYYNQIPDRCAY